MNMEKSCSAGKDWIATTFNLKFTGGNYVDIVNSVTNNVIYTADYDTHGNEIILDAVNVPVNDIKIIYDVKNLLDIEESVKVEVCCKITPLKKH